MVPSDADLVNVGRVAAVYGVKGWLKIHSDTQPPEQIFRYQPWWLRTAEGLRKVEVDASRRHGKGLVAHFRELDDRDLAARLTGADIAVERRSMPALEQGDYYWHQLVGLAVVSVHQGQRQRLGRVARLLETGANDVLVVDPDADSIDDRQRLVPWVPEQFVVAVDIEAGTVDVDWDPDF